MDKFTSGPGSIFLPLAVGAASALSPRIGHGLTAGLGVLDWTRRNTKANEEKEAAAAIPKYFGGGGAAPAPTALAGGEGAAAPTPPPSGPGPQASGPESFIAGVDKAINDPSVQKSPEQMRYLLSLKAHFSMQEPHKQIVPTQEGGLGMVTTPRFGGDPSMKPIPGTGKPQQFQQGLEDMLYATYGKGPYAPEQVQEARGKLLNETLDAEQRKEETSFRLAERKDKLQTDRYFDKLKDIEARQRFTAGQGQYNVITGRFKNEEAKVNGWVRNQIAAIGPMPGDPNDPNSRLGKEMQRINQQREEALIPVYQDFQRSYSDFRNEFPDHPVVKGGTPDYVQGKLDKLNSLGNTSDDVIYKKLQAINPKHAESFQKALKLNPANARKIGLGLLGNR